MMSCHHITATTPQVVPPSASEGVLPGGVVVARGNRPRTRCGAMDPVLAAFTQAGIEQDRCSSFYDGGGLRTRVEVTDRS